MLHFCRLRFSPLRIRHLLASDFHTAMSRSTIEGHGFGRTILLNDGYKMPMFGLGFYESEQALDVTGEALRKGYRLLDSAVFYGNEKEVGEGIKNSEVKREDIFLITKVWDNQHGYDEAIQFVKDSIKKFDVDYIDLILIHTPRPGKNLQTYDGLLKMKEQGFVRSVGVSNFGIQHLEGMRTAGRPIPAVNQIELSCFWRQEELVKYCCEHDIAVMGYSPIFRNQKSDHPVLVDIAKRYSRTVPQLMIRWSFQKDYITIPKTSSTARLVENANIFDFIISDEDMEKMDSLPITNHCAFGDIDVIATPWLG